MQAMERLAAVLNTGSPYRLHIIQRTETRTFLRSKIPFINSYGGD